MSNSLLIGVVHSRLFNRNQFRVMIDWFEFIHRCFFHSRWSCQNQAVIPSMGLYTFPFHSIQWSLYVQIFVVCSIFLTIIRGHWFRIQSSIDSFPSSLNPYWLRFQLFKQDSRFHWWKVSVADSHPLHIRINTFPYNSSPFLPTIYCTENNVWVVLVVSFVILSKFLNK